MAKINLKLIRRVLRHVKADLRRLEMSHYFRFHGKDSESKSIPACGTTACCAGWACILADAKTQSQIEQKILQMDASNWGTGYYFNRGKYLLGLTEGEAEIVFVGDASQVLHHRQYSVLKSCINQVLKRRGLRARV
jgi:hypothetical protein